ncbi:hypothetical protein K458DRAFT_146248 [Lentithecium fluviatile CBS 122367]|uniref:Uncharacterized protein n=1 Tax=Lentithecium fluviatile CBS 122367 TaxID=1168545 RepID=A0A6G1JDQ2_9PLEO|nr:hypothetical protein K458DRAFT_146248 [Lentithecium fluviatile CBS 122367]
MAVASSSRAPPIVYARRCSSRNKYCTFLVNNKPLLQSTSIKPNLPASQNPIPSSPPSKQEIPIHPSRTSRLHNHVPSSLFLRSHRLFGHPTCPIRTPN